MARVRLDPMTPDALDAWRREDRGLRGVLPTPSVGERQEALVVLLDGEPAGRVLLSALDAAGEAPGQGEGRGWSVRAIETSLHSDDTEEWAEVLTAIADHARDGGADLVDTAVPPRLAPVFEAAGYRTTGTVHAKRLAQDGAHFQEDRRVAVRPMDREERARFAADAREMVLAGVLRDGPPTVPGTSTPVHDRIARFGADPAPEDEVLLTATVEGEPVGRVWATAVPHDDGALDLVGHVIELFPEHRGRRLTPSLLGAMARHVRDLGVRDVHLLLDGADDRARTAFLRAGLTIADVRLRRDLGGGTPAG